MVILELKQKVIHNKLFKRILLITMILFLFSIAYFFVLLKFDLTLRDYDDYIGNPDCKIEKLDNGFTQIENCVQYKLTRIPAGDWYVELR